MKKIKMFSTDCSLSLSLNKDLRLFDEKKNKKTKKTAHNKIRLFEEKVHEFKKNSANREFTSGSNISY